MPIYGIFYARFLPQKGTKIVAQSPPGCIVPVAAADESESDTGVVERPKPGGDGNDGDDRNDRNDGDGGDGGDGEACNSGDSSDEEEEAHTVPGTASSAIPGTLGGGSSSSRGRGKALFDFDVMQEYVIPRAAFFNRYLAAREPSGRFTVLGLPVEIRDPKYDRNAFIFNFGIVVESGDDQGPYEQVVRRLASTFAEMEKQNQFLSREERREQQTPRELRGDGEETHGPYHRRSLQSLLEIIKEDLNLYGECMIPVDDANRINMKLFPQHADPPVVEGWHVPVPKIRLAEIVDASWDLTLQRVIAHMDGVSDVRRIAHEADVSLELCRAALRHLLYYDTVLLLDLFFFGSCYAPRPGIHDFVANVGGIVDECARYVCLGRDNPGGSGDSNSNGEHGHHESSSSGGPATTAAAVADHNDDPDHRPLRVSNFDLIRLMTSFCVGRTVTEWLKSHADAGFDVLRYVDVRRLVQFGVIKGCLYRVHKYAVSKQYLASLVTGQAAPRPRKNMATPPTVIDDPLQRYTDGNHHFDQIITEQNLTEVEILDRLKHLPAGDVNILYR